ncbi:hypothetical protein KEM54_006610 [Ascosphaera aggregata]|nr:hypothetical protein KEM54_006610 [Ascosphaera aggregata]
MAQRVDDVMTDVITQLKAVADHFQRNGFETLAIHFSRHIREMTMEFTEVMWKVNGEAAMMKSPVNPGQMSKRGTFQRKEKAPAITPVTTNLLDLSVDQASSQSEDSPVSEVSQEKQNDIQRPMKAQKPYEQNWRLHKQQQQQFHLCSGRQQPGTLTSPEKVPVVQRQQQHQQQQQQQAVAAQSPTPPQEAVELTATTAKPPPFEPKKKAGLMRLSGPFETAEFNDITGLIHVGPIYDIEFHRAIGFAEICFLHIEHAEEFVEIDLAHRQEKGYSCLGQGYEIEQIDEIEWTQGHHDMYDLRQRRRLTFVGSGLLTKVTEERFMRDLMAIAKEERIDFVWPFNSGNITAVFKSVDVAKHVARHFSVLSRKPASLYYRIQVDFSSDPCEKPLPLLTRYTTSHPGKVISLNGKPMRPKSVMKRTRVPFNKVHVVK